MTKFPSIFSRRIAASAALCAAGASFFATQSARAQPFVVNGASREEVRAFYNTVYKAAEGPVDVQWTGNFATCTPGTIAQSIIDRAQLRINYFRAMAGLPADVVLTADLNATAQAGAFLNSANNDTSHTPPTTWKCYSQQGADGAGSNLIGGSTTPDREFKSIDAWMDDSSPGNEPVGHRRWILLPSQAAMGYGDVPVTNGGPPNGNTGTKALYVFGTRKPQRPMPRDEFVAWPPKGYLPYQLVSPRWSFSILGADFANTTVTLTRNGATLPVTIEHRGNSGFGEVTLVWIQDSQRNFFGRPPVPTADETYTVAINNVMIGGAARNFTYNVVIFDPQVPGPDAAPPLITGPDSPPLNQNSTYNFSAVANANGYQWRASKLAAASLSDGAEAGLVNFDHNATEYTPTATNVKATGNASFRLNRKAGNSGVDQALTYKRVLMPSANSQITFKSRLVLADALEARVQVSTDDGGSWQTAYSQPGAGISEQAFSDKVVSLAQFAGRAIRLRFAYLYVGGPAFVSVDPLGWYIDDITFVNLQEAAGTPVVNDVAGGTSFSFNPTEQAAFDLNVRPRLFGQYFGEWGPSKRVSTLAGGGGGSPNTPTAPSIGTQPQGQTVNPGANVTFTVTAQGSTPLNYVWKKDGADLNDGAGIQGARTASLALQNVQAAQAGSYTVQVSNTAGNATSTPAVLVVNAPLSLATALDTTGLNWTSDGNGPWTAQTATTHDNVDAAQSGRIGDNQESRLETTVNGPATVAFWWKVDSEQNFDFLRLDLDGATQFRTSGTVNWEAKTVAIPTGSHTLRWIYSKDASDSRGADTAWVDQVEVRQAQPPPSLGEALDNTDLQWATAGDRPWFAETTTTHDGTDAVQSGLIADSQTSRLEATVLGPANLTFWWKVDSEQNYDFLAFELDTNRPFDPISGAVDWQQKTVPIPAGTHVIRWLYTKDASALGGSDAGWVDQVVLTKLTPGEAGEPGPTIEYAASGAKLRITWPDSAEGFKLQSSPTVDGGWTDVPENDISKEAGVFFIQVNTAAGARFYRLIEVE